MICTFFWVTCLTVFILGLTQGVGTAGDFDGSKSLLCTPINIAECGPGADCRQTTAEAINLSQFLVIDFKEQLITPTRESGRTNVSRIKKMEHIDGKLILQGMEDGRADEKDGLGWTASISEETGKLVLTASGDQVAFVIFGACTPR